MQGWGSYTFVHFDHRRDSFSVQLMGILSILSLVRESEERFSQTPTGTDLNDFHVNNPYV